ncbi:chromosome segregation protein SMC [Halieaceae bacterium IMCC14734]|uniref:Chromosome partition protein Smc n=1 Tax=Candidatus Litorirhabdus singularis TaxID=2518993 RepID=A0ABT3TI82_9GAMM|nr:chromosome segregation protein SMC [Candidatus Litorirhabdus singularis]MCX2981500.1 chromosome segregation protein SMC [Candidatus Litorirhabdus singularis]
MRLKSIKLAGFKSFVDPTHVQLPSNMCAVVGPNGCGKSNVIDAVRWVMGESSAKNLRGESMTDVIFNGSVNRQPVGQAHIELVFDNQDGKVGGEYASYSEISIKRQVTREGQSEYFLNGSKCRRRDITDIFLGTGLGPRSYAIIEQGMISRLIESRPEDLRVFIEEAAGISKYKERRKETESRMRRTHENLERLTDLREELERQLQHLQRQAQSAEKYADYKAEERLLSAQLHALQWRTLDTGLSQAKHEIGERDIKLESVIADQRQVDARIEEYRVGHTDATDQFNEVQARFYGLGSEIARNEQTLKHQQERGSQLAEDLAQTDASFTEAGRHLADDSERQAMWQEEITGVLPELELLQQAEELSAAALLEAESEMATWQQEWDEFNQVAAEPRQQAEVQQSRIQHLEQALQRLQNRIGTLEQEQKSLAAGPADNESDMLGEQLAEQELVIAEHQQRSEQLLEQVNATRDRRSAVASELDQSRGNLQTMRGRHASLEALQQASVTQGAGVEGWLQGQQLDQNPRLLEQLQVEPRWQRAVETVLGDYLQAICVDDIDPLQAALAELPEGNLLLLDRGRGGEAGVADSLLDQVQGGQELSGLLGSVCTAENLADALVLRASLAAHQSVITPEGVWLGTNWLRVNRLADEEVGVIERQQALEELHAGMQAAATQCAQLEAEQEQLASHLKELEAQRQQSLNQLQVETRQHADISARLSAEQAKIEQINKRRDGIETEIDDLRTQFRSEQDSIAEARQLLAAAIESMESDSQRREQLLSRRDSSRQNLDSARQNARHDKDNAHQLAMRHQSLQTQLQSMEQSIARTSAQVEQLLERKQALQESLASNDQPLDDLRAELEELLEQRLLVESELGGARQALSAIDHQMREAETERGAIEQRAQSVRQELEQLRLQQQTLDVKRENVQQLLKDAEQDLESVLRELPEEAAEVEWQMRLDKVAARIARLGPINLAAIDEYSQQSERKNYLDAQNQDLESALETLESAIRKIDKETRNRFRETFETVNSSLQELFPKVFGGGSAYLEMTGDDLLDTGITIMARPPGKKNSTIHLLSGGEKALTAIALVFSIFRLNPAPFCMLDEVDAPLDDANTARYARMVKEMSDQVQFIFITHNKITMEMADHLLGVTMQEPGVSRLVSVDVEEAAELAAV